MVCFILISFISLSQGLVPVIGSIVCLFMSYVYVARPLSLARLRPEQLRKLKVTMWKLLAIDFFVSTKSKNEVYLLILGGKYMKVNPIAIASAFNSMTNIIDYLHSFAIDWLDLPDWPILTRLVPL